MDHLGALLGQQLQLQGVDLVQAAGRRHQVRVGLHHAAHVLEQLAAGGAQRDRQHHGREVGPAAAQRGQLAVRPDPLEARHHRHQAVGQGSPQPARQDAAHLRAQVRGRGPDAGLGAAERAGGDAPRLEAHREQGGRQRLAGGQRPVGLAGEARSRRSWPGWRSAAPWSGRSTAAEPRIASVTPSKAETTTTGRSPAARCSATAATAAAMSSGRRRTEPPNLSTTTGAAGCAGGTSGAHGGSL